MNKTSETGDPAGRKEKKSGVALILVLGLLSVLMLSAVAFSISMRIERRGAFNFRYGVQARHMLWTGLADAISNINHSLTGGAFLVYPTNNMLSWPTPSTNWSRGIMVCSGSTDRARFIKRSQQNAVSPETWYSLMLESEDPGNRKGKVKPYWTPVLDRHSNELGRFSYIIVNQSGLIDANYAGGFPRMGGRGPEEIQLDSLPEFMSAAQADVFLNTRNSDARYETVEELARIQKNNLTFQPPASFSVYSLSFETQRLSMVAARPQLTPKIALGTNEASIISNKLAIITALQTPDPITGQRLVNSPTEAEFVFSNLLDYVDVDCVPKNLAQPYTECFPMINEVYVTNVCHLLGGMARFLVILNIETFYPFTKPSSNNFGLGAMWTLILTNTSSGGRFSNDYQFAYGAYGPLYNTNRYYAPPNNIAPPLVIPQIAATTGDIIQASYYLRAWITNSLDGTTNDLVPCDNGMSDLMLFVGSMPMIATNVPFGAQTGKETIDPRFNWHSAQHWAPYNAAVPPGTRTLGSENGWTKKYMSISAAAEDGTDMYVPEYGGLQSVGELGNLLMGAANSYMWRTFRLFDTSTKKRDLIFETFSLLPESGYSRGRVNINATNMSVIGSVFTNCPFGYMSTNNPLTDVSRIISFLRADPSRVYYDIGDMGGTNKAGFLYTSWKDVFPGSSDCVIESVISQSAELLTARHNLFTIFLAANTSAGGMSGRGRTRTLSSAYATVELWRDPFPSYDVSGHRFHKCFIRRFQILDE